MKGDWGIWRHERREIRERARKKGDREAWGGEEGRQDNMEMRKKKHLKERGLLSG